MKRIILFTTLLITIFSLRNSNAQCITLPDTIYNCGFTVEVMPTEFNFPGFWIYDCEMGDGNISIAETMTGIFTLTFSNCGYYTLIFFAEECNEEKTVVFRIDDPSYTSTEITGNNDLGYFNYSCHSDGASCDNEVTIDGEVPPNPEWDICYDLFCEYTHYFTTSIPTDPQNCIAQFITVDSVSGSNSSSGCQLFDADDITAENFCTIVDAIYGNALDGSQCPIAEGGCFDIGPECIDSITFDTLELLFPIHDGGRWTMLENMDTIILSDTTAINKYMRDLLFVIEPGADYYGPGDLTFSLFELLANGDTIPTTFDAEFTLWWQELWHYDTITEIIPIIHYSDDPECQPCGGNQFSSSKNIPGIPEYLCPPIMISFGDPCSCEEGGITINGNEITCFEPCTILDAQVNFNDPAITVDSSFWTGPSGDFGGGSTVTVCEGGLYTYTIITSPNGCEYSESFFVEEDLDVPNVTITGNFVIDCFNECSLVFIDIENPQEVTGTCVYPNGDVVQIDGPIEPIVLCEPGTVYIELINSFNGCGIDLEIEIIDETEPLEFAIEPTELITCVVDCVPLNVIDIDIPDGAEYLWTGPNSFTDNSPNSIACEIGTYELTIIYGSCIQVQTVEVSDFFAPVVIQDQAQVCEGDCFFWQGEEYCLPGTYTLEGECDSTFTLELIMETPMFIDKYEFICEGDQIEVDGEVYDTEGVYPYEILDGTLCPTFVSLEIEVFEMDLFVSGTPSVDCSNPSTTLSVSTTNPEQNFYWYDPQNQLVSSSYQLVVTEPGIYTVQNVSTNNLCVAELQIEVEGNLEMPELEVSVGQNLNCENEIQLFIDVEASATLDFYWSGPNIPADQIYVQNPIITEPGVYEVIIENEFGCVNSGVIEVIQLDEMEADVNADKSCIGDANGRIEINVNTGGVGPFEYKLMNGAYQTANVFEGVEPGIYTVYIMQADGCEWEDEIEVEAIEAIEPTVSFDATYELCETPVLEFDLTKDIEDHANWDLEWNDGSKEVKRSFSESGDYSLTISNECELREFIFRVDDSRLQDELPIYIANMFTPNADGVNDEFKVHTAVLPNTFNIDIYDRWGNKVFESQDIDFSWNGNYHSVTAKSDVYAYIATYSYLECMDEEKSFQIIGDVTVIR